MNMEHVRKMALVPADPSFTTSLPNHLNPEVAITQNAIQSLDEEMKSILDNSNLQEDQKLKMYSHALQKRIRLVSKYIPPAVMEPVHRQGPTEKDIVSSVPVRQQGKARRIISAIKQRPDVLAWNEDWQLVYEGQPIDGTNVVDLIHSLLRERKPTTYPKGWKELREGIKRINIPLTFIGTKMAIMEEDSAPVRATPPKKLRRTVSRIPKWSPMYHKK